MHPIFLRDYKRFWQIGKLLNVERGNNYLSFICMQEMVHLEGYEYKRG